MVIIMTMAAVDECRRSLPGMGHDFFDDVAPSTIFLAPVAMWRSDWEWAWGSDLEKRLCAGSRVKRAACD